MARQRTVTRPRRSRLQPTTGTITWWKASTVLCKPARETLGPCGQGGNRDIREERILGVDTLENDRTQWRSLAVCNNEALKVLCVAETNKSSVASKEAMEERERRQQQNKCTRPQRTIRSAVNSVTCPSAHDWRRPVASQTQGNDLLALPQRHRPPATPSGYSHRLIPGFNLAHRAARPSGHPVLTRHLASRPPCRRRCSFWSVSACSRRPRWRFVGLVPLSRSLQMTVLNHPASRHHTFLATRGIIHKRQVFFAGAPAHFLRTSHFYGLGLSYVRSTTKNIVHLAGRAATEPTRACLPHRPPWTSQQNTDLASCALSALTYTWERRHPSTPACFTTARLVPPAKSHFGAMKHWSSVASCWWSNPSSKRQ